jgi:hypothetical protein
MQSRNFVVKRRPRLAAIKAHPKMDFADYERRLTSLQGALQLIQQAYLGTQRALVVLEGWDTAGKGGVVRRLGWALDPRSFKVTRSPRRTSRTYPTLPRALLAPAAEDGQIVLFDRSWYGRVLVERVEGFATTEEWRRATARSTSSSNCGRFGDRLVKLFLHITTSRCAGSGPADRSFEAVETARRGFRDGDRGHDGQTATKAPWYLIPPTTGHGRIARCASSSTVSARTCRWSRARSIGSA